MVGLSEIITGLIGGGFATACFWYMWRRKDVEIERLEKRLELSDKEQQKLSEKVAVHDKLHVTETRSRHIAEEVFSRIDRDVSETKNLVQSMVDQMNNLAVQMQTDTAVRKALSKLKDQSD